MTASALAFAVLAACAAPPQSEPQVDVPPRVVEQPTASSDCNTCGERYRIALLLPLSGPQQALGHEALNGAMMAFYELHSPRKVEVRPYDTQGTVEGARAAARRALDDGADIFAGPIFKDNVLAAAEIVAPTGLPLIALSNDKSIAQQNVRVLGGHLEEEVESLVQIILRSNRRKVLLFAPDNAYGNRLRDEFQKLLDPHYAIDFETALFPSPASTDQLTKRVSTASEFETRYDLLQEVLSEFQKRWQETEDSSLALSRTVDAFGLTDRWEEAYPLTCVYENAQAPDEALILETAAPEDATPSADETSVMMEIPEGPALMPAYEHTRNCDTPSLDHLSTEIPEEWLEATSDESVTEPVIAETDITETYLHEPDLALLDMPQFDPVENARREARVRHEDGVQDARFGLFQDLASCLTYLSGKEYEEQKGVETITRRFAQREVLGPLETDTIILPLTSDQLRIVSSLFEYYHAGREQTLILGTGLWDRAQDLSDEMSLRGARWVSDMQAHSPGGALRYETYFNTKPSFMSALAYDAILVSLNETRADEPGTMPPGAPVYLFGESGTLSLNDDGTNTRQVSVKELTDDGDVVSTSLKTYLAQAPFRAFKESQAKEEDALDMNQEHFLQRMCVGAR